MNNIKKYNNSYLSFISFFICLTLVTVPTVLTKVSLPVHNETFLKIVTIVSYGGAVYFYIKSSLISLVPSIFLIPVCLIFVVAGKSTFTYCSLGLVVVNQLVFMFSEKFIHKF